MTQRPTFNETRRVVGRLVTVNYRVVADEKAVAAAAAAEAAAAAIADAHAEDGLTAGPYTRPLLNSI